VFVSGKPFQPTLIFVSMAGAYPSVPLKGGLLNLLTVVTLGWKDLPVINTLAHYEHFQITAVIFYNIGSCLLSNMGLGCICERE
jgi:hypothetical protein